jgi:natural product precursor
MSHFIKLSELKEKKLKEEELKNVKGGFTLHYGMITPVLDYGVIPPPW